MVTVKFQNKINKYTVEAIWKPTNVRYNHIVGPAIVTFKNSSEDIEFSISINKFSILKSQLPFSYSSDDLEITKLNRNSLDLVYDLNKLTDTESTFGNTNVPFFFQDLDFDNEKELIFTEIDNGQRGVATFKVFGLDDGDLESELYDKTNSEPFTSLDTTSKFDVKNKRIIIYGSGGMCSNSYTFYQLIPAKNDFPNNYYQKIASIFEVRDDSLNKCFQKTYKVIQEKLELINSKEMN